MSSHSDTVSIYLICMTCKAEGRGKLEKGRKKKEERMGRSGRNRRRYKDKGGKASPKKTSACAELAVREFFWKSAWYKEHLKWPI